MRISARALALLLPFAALSGCGGDENTQSTLPDLGAAPKTAPARTPWKKPKPPPPAGPKEDQAHKEPKGDPHLGGLPKPGHRALHRARHPQGPAGTVSAYVRALDADDGAAACRLFAAGAIGDFDFPVERADCPASMEASIGYRDPRGSPVFAGASLEAIRSVTIDSGLARVTATVRTDFSDREASIEDDVIYLRRSAGSWRLAKPSATLYFAIGAPEVPLSALAPPG